MRRPRHELEYRNTLDSLKSWLVRQRDTKNSSEILAFSPKRVLDKIAEIWERKSKERRDLNSDLRRF